MSQTFKWCQDKTKLKIFDKQVFVTDINGTKRWYLNGEMHRENGPAVEYTSGSKAWYLNGERHRENGPAVEYANGRKCWYLNGVYYSESDYLYISDMNQPFTTFRTFSNDHI